MTNNDIKHTKEPWHLFSHRGSKTVAILDVKKRHQPEVVKWGGFDEEPFSLQEANAKRIVAAVNFCEGFSNKRLAKMGSLKDLKSHADMRDEQVVRLIKNTMQTQWQPYDKDDKETHPPTGWLYVCRTEDDPTGLRIHLMYFGGWWHSQANDGKERGIVTEYMDIPCPGGKGARNKLGPSPPITPPKDKDDG